MWDTWWMNGYWSGIFYLTVSESDFNLAKFTHVKWCQYLAWLGLMVSSMTQRRILISVYERVVTNDEKASRQGCRLHKGSTFLRNIMGSRSSLFRGSVGLNSPPFYVGKESLRRRHYFFAKIKTVVWFYTKQKINTGNSNSPIRI